MGMVFVAFMTARAAGVVTTTIMSTFSPRVAERSLASPSRIFKAGALDDRQFHGSSPDEEAVI
jgi:hypothetical protein